MSTTRDTLRTVPQITIFRNLTPTGLLDDQLIDPFNFNLHEDVAAVISSFTTGIAIILLADLVFRVVVRAERVNVSSHAIYRMHMLSRVANPLTWGSALSSTLFHRRRNRPQA